MRLQIPFSEIPEQGVQLEITDLSWFPERILVRDGPVTAHIQLTKKKEDKIELQGTVQVALKFNCDRCLQEYSYSIDEQLQLIVEMPQSDRHWRLQEMEAGPAELDAIQVEEPRVDLGDILRQQVLLAVPEKRLCSEQCMGLCRRCGANLNTETCSCENESPDSPFAVLSTLKIRKKH